MTTGRCWGEGGGRDRSAGLRARLHRGAKQRGSALPGSAPPTRAARGSSPARPAEDGHGGPRSNQAIVNNTALKKALQPEDLTGAAVFLASSESDLMTGQVLVVDAGMIMLG